MHKRYDRHVYYHVYTAGHHPVRPVESIDFFCNLGDAKAFVEKGLIGRFCIEPHPLDLTGLDLIERHWDDHKQQWREYGQSQEHTKI